MGMGKSLTTLALIVRTLMDGRKWVEEHEVSQGDISAERPTRATLVVVPRVGKKHPNVVSHQVPKLIPYRIDNHLVDGNCPVRNLISHSYFRRG